MEKMIIKFTIKLTPVSKKNHQRILYRYTTDKYGRQSQVPFISPSEQYKTYEESAMWFIPRYMKINEPVNIKCIFYMDTHRKCDLTNMLESVDDIMVKAGLLADDNYTIIESHDGSRVLYDKANPRTEVYISKSEGSV